MSIQRTYKQSDLEKRLKLLEMQLHGKKEKLEVRSEKMDKQSLLSDESKEVRSLKLEDQTSNIKPRAAGIASGDARQNPVSNIQHPTSSTDVSYLRADLTKIFILSTIAVGAQFLLFFGSRYGFLRLF